MVSLGAADLLPHFPRLGRLTAAMNVRTVRPTPNYCNRDQDKKSSLVSLLNVQATTSTTTPATVRHTRQQ